MDPWGKVIYHDIPDHETVPWGLNNDKNAPF